MYRITAAPANGNTVAPVQQDTGDAALGASIVVRHDGSTTDTGALPTALSVTGLGAIGTAVPMWEQTVPKLTTAAGYVPPIIAYLVPDDSRLNGEDPAIMRPGQGIAVRLEAPPAAVTTAGATNGPYVQGTWTFHFKAVIGEFLFV
jgi:hypothetical protein